MVLVHAAAGYFSVFIIHQTMMWTTGSLMCMCNLFACVHIYIYIHTYMGTSVYGLIQMAFVVSLQNLTPVYGLIQMAFVVSLQNLTPEKSQGGSKALHIMVALPFHGHTQNSTLAFESKSSCSGPPTLSLFTSLTWYGLPHVNTCSFFVFK